MRSKKLLSRRRTHGLVNVRVAILFVSVFGMCFTFAKFGFRVTISQDDLGAGAITINTALLTSTTGTTTSIGTSTTSTSTTPINARGVSSRDGAEHPIAKANPAKIFLHEGVTTVNCDRVVAKSRIDPGFVKTSTTPSFPMSIHSLEKDKSISKSVADSGCFECHIHQALLNALLHISAAPSTKEDTVFVDMGTNIGLYTTAAANLGFQTVSFEPVYANYERTCQTVVKNGWQNRVNLLNRALTKSPEILNFDMKWAKHKNMGGIAVVQGDDAATGQTTPNGKEGEDFAFGVPFDSIFDGEAWKGKHVVLKVDVEGHECTALEGALSALRQVKIEYVAIEFSNDRLKECKIHSQLVELFQSNSLVPFQYTSDKGWLELDPSKWQSWRRLDGKGRRFWLYDMAWSKGVPDSESNGKTK